MIKNFNTYIREGRMGRLVNADDNTVRKQDKLTEEEVRSYIYKGCERYCKTVIIRYKGNQPIVDIEGDFIFRENITEIPFQFGEVTGCFSCSDCQKLTSLKGCPEKVGVEFNCNNCKEITSLEGCPEEVSGNFYCNFCLNLTSIEGCPKKVVGNFYCHDCGKKFTEKEVKSLCNIEGVIEVI